MSARKLFHQALVLPMIFSILISYSPLLLASTSRNKNFISYTDSGVGQPLVFIHAFPTDQHLWDPQREELKKKFRVITLDLWGFGKSSAVDGSAITMTDYANEVKKLMIRLNIPKAIIAGESMGGYIALAFLQKYPENVSGLILSDTQAIADSIEIKKKREATALDVLAHGTKTFMDGFMPKALTQKASEQMKRELRNMLDGQSPNALASALRGMALREDTSNLLAATKLPVLIISGEYDQLISPQQSQIMHQLARNSVLVTIPNAAHLSSLEKYKEWNESVISMFYENTY